MTPCPRCSGQLLRSDIGLTCLQCGRSVQLVDDPTMVIISRAQPSCMAPSVPPVTGRHTNRRAVATANGRAGER